MGLLQAAVCRRRPGCISRRAHRCAVVSYVASLLRCTGCDSGFEVLIELVVVLAAMAGSPCLLHPCRGTQKAADNAVILVGVWCRLGAERAASLLLLHERVHSLHLGLINWRHVLLGWFHVLENYFRPC